MVKRVIFGDVANKDVAALNDVNIRELSFLIILAFLVLLFGIWPAPLVKVTQTSVVDLLQHIGQSKL
jgi:NADH-quinone oxidoreductase subunit M